VDLLVLAKVNNATGSGSDVEAITFFAIQWVVVFLGWGIHLLVDRRRHGHQPGRATELLLLWVLVFGGAWAIYGGIGHTSGVSDQVAESIGYAPSMFQWEVGWGDIALGVLGIGCAWKALRGQWMTAAVVVLAVQYGGDAIGHLMQWVANDNTAPDNVWALPSDVLQPLLAIVLLWMYRKQPVDEPVAAPVAEDS
jgi:hypothetical protein